jgi:4-amino-4-deoxy-L-arabinose transferase-like glycosyltransferase
MRFAGLLALPMLALLLLAAHFVHSGLMPLAALAVLLVGLLAVRRPWSARTLQVVLAVAVIEWILTTVGLAQLRLRHDEPYLRLAVILGSVTLLTALAACVFQHRVLRAYFGWPTTPATGPSAR